MSVEALFPICSMRLGGRCHDRIYHVDRADEFGAVLSLYVMYLKV